MLVAAGSVPFAFDSVVLGGAGMLVMGIGIPITVVAFSTLRQRMTPDALQGRTGAAANVLVNLPQTLVSIIGAGLLVFVDYRVLIWAAVGAVIVGAATALRARRVPVLADAGVAPLG